MSAAPSQVASVTSQKPQDAEPAMAVIAQERKVIAQPSSVPRKPSAGESAAQRAATA